MKYTRSRDGVERANLFVHLRVDRETMAELRRRAKNNFDGCTLHEYLSQTFWNGFHADAAAEEADAELDRIYGEGD